MNIPFSEFFNYLFRHNPNVDVKYREERYSGDIKVTDFLSRDIAGTLAARNDTAYNNFMDDINTQVRDQLRQSNLYRFVAIIGLLFAVLGLSMILYFSSGNTWVILGGAYYSFFAYLLVEAYIQANRNYFEDQLYKRLMKNYFKN
ncbi:hypothetical protein GCM10007275_17060 [Jeotgalicoccus coquinae]|uniref:Uncharacterized protein n=1 Tax=Jeotgalicoccus coquinae TaxID=709509 RepID=A0A6V7R0W5_9STAP|nr:hypothetical protein [Jeotgalicoccus coquinae]MBB6423785.1 hypothetical protein [Jeotgalicoccus coquinae]GGE22551.1 hypothetical protein GCM10007275_17060 [Jeotgalicoccus coquinae]CAD2070673.1 hypothetical protein JEOCOQ751_00022 [Jeotgalicoccus coquinae]